MTTKSTRGFGALDSEKRREIARLGGKAAHARGVAHRFSSEEARQAGRKGGEIVSQNREHMSEIGRLGARAQQGRTHPPMANQKKEPGQGESS
ncbi:MAG: KGG domain-containing protein [Polyangiaceae bacterium]